MQQREDLRPFLPVLVFSVLSTLYFSQGLPAGLLAHGLPAILREQGVSLTLIGLTKLLALPWAFKFLWAGWVDRHGWQGLGHTRNWAGSMQLGVIGLLCLLALFPQDFWLAEGLGYCFACLFLINLLTATQDVATDGLAVRLLPARWRGLGNSIQVIGYKVGLVLGGSLLLMLLHQWGWKSAFLLQAVILAALLLVVVCFRDPPGDTFKPPERAGSSRRWIRHALDWMSQIANPYWLVVLFTYKLADELGSGMIKPLLVDQGWSLWAIGEFNAWVSLVGMLGALAGGLLYFRLGAARSLVMFAAMQALAISAFLFISLFQLEKMWVFVLGAVEQFTDGLSTVVLFAVMMHHCRKGCEGHDYTLQACIHLGAAGLFGLLSGLLADWVGYNGLYLLCGLVGALMMFPVLAYVNHERQACELPEKNGF